MICCRKSVVAQRGQRLDARCASSRQVARHGTNGNERQDRTDERERVIRRQTEEQAGNCPAECECPGQAERAPDNQQKRYFA